MMLLRSFALLNGLNNQPERRTIMNYRGIYKRGPLTPCRVCGMDAGERMVTMTVPEEFFVQCLCCGYEGLERKKR